MPDKICTEKEASHCWQYVADSEHFPGLYLLENVIKMSGQLLIVPVVFYAAQGLEES